MQIVFLFCLLVVTPVSFPVCQQLTGRIEQLLGNKNTPYYMKSITCIQAFREQSVKVNKHLLSFIQANAGMWWFLVVVCHISRTHSLGFPMEIKSQSEKIIMSPFKFSQMKSNVSSSVSKCTRKLAFR